MKHTFKTNINCGNCIKSVSPYLNKNLDIEKWEVDTDNPDKILTVEGDLNADEVVKTVEEAGYEAEKVS